MPSVVISVAGVDVTADVVFDGARFKSLVNGNPGEAFMRVRDLDSTYDFTEGSDWLLAVDGEAVWRGFVTAVKRAYIFPAGDVSESGLQRFWDLTGADLNILFTRRVVFDTADPTNVEGTQFAAGTADTVAITELLGNWLDLSSDDLDTTSSVVGVGDIDPAQKTRAWSGGWYWGAAMGSIAMIPAAIYYLRPEMGSPRGTLVYCDVDVPDAPFGLSDQPNGTTTKGFREMEIILDGTSLANDVLAIGMGYGSQTPVVKRLQSTTSQASHGLWQQGLLKPGVYKQATIDRIADSVVNGSPESKRGAKNDRPAVQLVTYEPGLLAGYKVDFTSEVWGWTDVIPVRQMEVTFESPTAPRYELLLSHEIDSPWSFIDQFWPSIPTPNWCPDPPCFVWPPPPPPSCDCGITDSFTRTISATTHTTTGSQTGAYIGDADAGSTWSVELAYGGISIEVDGTSLVATSFPVGSGPSGIGVGGFAATLPAHAPVDTSVTRSVTFSLSQLPAPVGSAVSYDSVVLSFGLLGNDPTACSIQIGNSSNTIAQMTSFIGDGSGTHTSIPNSYWQAGVTYTVTVTTNGANNNWEITNGVLGYAVSMASAVSTIDSPYITAGRIYGVPTVTGDASQLKTIVYTIDTLDIPEVTRCSALQFDDFERTVASGWGNATPSGYAWTTATTAGTVTFSVDGTTGKQLNVGYNPPGVMVAGIGYSSALTPVNSADGFTMLMLVQFDGISVGGSMNIAVVGGSFGMSLDIFGGFSGGTMDSRFSDGATLAFANLGWTDGSVYWVQFQVSGSTATATIWENGTSQPTPQFSLSGATSDTTLATISITGGSLSATHGDQQTYVESIDFDYAGRPCYFGSGCLVASCVSDDLDRTVASPDWGGSWTTTASTAAQDGIAPGIANMADVASWGITRTVSSQTELSTHLLDLSGCATTNEPFDYIVAWTADAAFNSYAAYDTLGSPPPGSYNFPGLLYNDSGILRTEAQQFLQFVFFSSSYSTAGDNPTKIRITTVGGVGYWSMSFGGALTTYQLPTTFTFTAGSTYALRVQHSVTGVSARMWNLSSPEPTTWAYTNSSTGNVDAIRPTSFQALFTRGMQGGSGTSDPAASYTFNPVKIDLVCGNFLNANDPVNAFRTGTPQAPTGFGCEEPTRTSSTVYTTSGTFQPNTTFVWRDGLFQRRGTDYTEDSGNQTITFSDAVAPTSVIRMCYFAETAGT